MNYANWGFKIIYIVCGLFAAMQLSWPITPPPNYGLSLFVALMSLYVALTLKIFENKEYNDR